MSFFRNKIFIFLQKGSDSSVNIKKNVAGSLCLKVINIFISLQVVPLTIHYVNPSKYGVWLTLSSIIAWISYFDFGFAHGFRNRFAEAIAKGEFLLARKYVSTTYAVLFILFSIICVILLGLNSFLDWTRILKLEPSLILELRVLMQILICFFCLYIVANIFTTMLTAYQKPALASLINTGGQVFAFIAIYLLTKFTSGSLINLAFAFSGIPCLVLIIVSVFVFSTKRYSAFAPCIRYVNFRLTRNIIGLGGKFFIIMISMLFSLQFINIIISRIQGPDAVTQYNIAYKYFSIINMIALIILTPFWSAFTDAYVKKDFGWMAVVVKKLERLWLLCIPAVVIMIICSEVAYAFWIGNSVHINMKLSIIVSLYVLFQTLGSTYMYLINGTGKVTLQMILYICFAFVSIPLMSLCCEKLGTIGAVVVPCIIIFIQAIVGKIQINLIVNQKAYGLWNK